MFDKTATKVKNSLGAFALPALGLAALTVTGLGVRSCNYIDDRVVGIGTKDGRDINSMGTLLSGLIAQRVWGEAEVSAVIEKSFFPDSTATGTVTLNSIGLETSVWLTDNKFYASGPQGKIRGIVEKTEQNWEIVQKSEDSYEIQRFMLKLDPTLKLTVKDGKISGDLQKQLALDWSFEGTYDLNAGTFKLNVVTPWHVPNFSISGKVHDFKLPEKP